MYSNVKNLISSLTAIGLLINNPFPIDFVTIPSVNASAQSNVLGDIDGDGEITSSDALSILQVVVGNREETSNCDVDKDGAVTSSDALLILKVVIGIDTLEQYEINLSNMYSSTVSELQKQHTLTKYYSEEYDIYFYHVEDLGNTVISYDIDNPEDIMFVASDSGTIIDGINVGMPLSEVVTIVGNDNLTYKESIELKGFSSNYVQYNSFVDNELVLVMLPYDTDGNITGGVVVDFLTGVMLSSQISK